MKHSAANRAFFALILLLAGLAPMPAFAEPGDDRVLTGTKFVQKKDYKKAIVEYEEAVKVNPSHAKAHLLLGMTYANLGDFAKAEKHVKDSLAQQPSYDGFHTLGLVYANKGEYAKALEAYENAVQMNPKAFRAWYQLGAVHAASGNFKNAIDSYKKCIELNPQYADAYQGLGAAYYWSGEKLQALEQVNALKAVKAKSKAIELEKWLDTKETQKKQKTQPAGAPA